MLKKIFYITLIIMIITLLLLPNFVKATEINMNLTNPSTNILNTSNNTISNTSSQSNVSSNQNYISSDNALTHIPETYTSSSSTVGTLSSLHEAELGLTNILCIILIVIGILLILLAIAILIRLAH